MRIAGPRKFVLNWISFAPALASNACCAITWPMEFISVAVPRVALAALNVALTMPGWTFTSILDFAAMRVGTMAMADLPQSPVEFALMSSPVAMPSSLGFLVSKLCSVSAVPSAFQRSMLLRYMSPVNCVP